MWGHARSAKPFTQAACHSLAPSGVPVSDLRGAWRALRATPLVSFVAILSLALGIGANAAMFSLVDALVLRGLPVRHADRLAMLFDDVSKASFWSQPIWESIKRRPELTDGAFAFSGFRFDLAEGGEIDPADGLFASGRMFEVMGVDAAIGRTFTGADDVVGGGLDGPVAVLSYGFWQRRFGGAPDIIGRRISVDRALFTIVGVTGPRFFGPEVGRSFDVAVPLNTEPWIRKERSNFNSGSSWLQMVFRLAPGQTPEQATAGWRQVQPQIRDETLPIGRRPDELARYLANPLTIRPGSTVQGIRDQYEKPLFALMGIVGLTLLIACGNIANLLLARATARRHEFSVRSALGASAGRLARQLLAESALLSAAGAALGVVVAVLGSRFLVSQLSMTTNRVFNRVFIDVGVDWRMLAFTATAGVATALLFGVAPAMRSARAAPIDAMKDQGRGTSSARRGFAGSLVMVQVAMSLVLLIGAGLFVRTFASLSNRDLGLDRGGILVVDINSERAGTDSAERVVLYERLAQSVSGIPEVASAALSSITPVSGSNSTRRMLRVDRPPPAEADRRVWVNVISPGWFSTMGTRIVAGRDFNARDRMGAARAVIVNETFVRKHFGSENPLGQLIVEEPASFANPTPLEIVGVIEDAVYRSVREPVPPTMYWPVAQQARPPVMMSLMVRVRTASLGVVSRDVIAAVAAVNPNLTISARPFSDIVDAALSRERLVAKLSGFFGALALILAALGLYGVTSYSVNRRHTELGIRMALGTTPSAVVRLVLSHVGVLVGAGLLIGIVVSWWVSQFTGALLYNLAPRDVPTMAGAVLVLASVAAFAAWLPARRAARIDPASVLRDM
jgi:putative ABC transport system permease protein